jgi:hypothetical protein
MPHGRSRHHRRCTVADCNNPHLAKGLCRAHYKQKRRLEGPRCSVPGCDRRVAVRGRGLCSGHLKDPTRTIRVLRAKADRALAWGRLVVDRASIPVLKAEAKRRGLGPSALMADVIDRWCKSIATGGWPRNSLAPCAYPGCERPLYYRALCRTHHWQRQHGKELTPIRPYGPGDVFEAFGHLRLTPELAKRLKASAKSRRVPVAELVRQLLDAGLP